MDQRRRDLLLRLWTRWLIALAGPVFLAGGIWMLVHDEDTLQGVLTLVLGIGWSAQTIALLKRRPNQSSPLAEKPAEKSSGKPPWWGALQGALIIVISFGVFRWAPVTNEDVRLAIAAACSLVALAAVEVARSARLDGRRQSG